MSLTVRVFVLTADLIVVVNPFESREGRVRVGIGEELFGGRKGNPRWTARQSIWLLTIQRTVMTIQGITRPGQFTALGMEAQGERSAARKPWKSFLIVEAIPPNDPAVAAARACQSGGRRRWRCT